VKNRLNLEPVKNWLGFTRRERRSTSVLLSIIFFIICLRYTLPEKNINIADWGGIPSDTSAAEESQDNYSASKTGFIPDSTSSHDTMDSSLSADAGHPFPNRRHRAVASVQANRSSSKVDLNRCDTSALIALPGIGSVLSVRILKYRSLLGGFASVEQLKEVYGLSAETFELIRERCLADTSAVRRVSVNTSDYRELCRIPYIQKYEVAAILKYRELKGRIGGITDLTGNKILTPEQAEKTGPYMDFR
jgi:DNA uptake protein ComE-like DNA-binding protein